MSLVNQKHAYQLRDFKLSEEVECCIEEEVESRRARCEVGPPPPQVILTAQLEVAKHNGYFGTSDNEDGEDQEEEAEDVIDVRIKKSSMKTAPNGSIPPIRTEKTGFMYHACSGICLGILFVFTGFSIAGFLNPT
ncbi:hypothetical protein CR513_52285, partial [Mucuna pruriens]